MNLAGWGELVALQKYLCLANEFGILRRIGREQMFAKIVLTWLHTSSLFNALEPTWFEKDLRMLNGEFKCKNRFRKMYFASCGLSSDFRLGNLAIRQLSIWAISCCPTLNNLLNQTAFSLVVKLLFQRCLMAVKMRKICRKFSHYVVVHVRMMI